MVDVENAVLSVTTIDRRIVGRHIKFEPTSLVISDDLEYTDWEHLGEALLTVSRGHGWWIGDWLNYGERKYGEMYSQALEATGLEYNTLQAARYVAERFELLRRRNNLSWSHHREVAAMESDEADHWLDLAEAEYWSREQLRTEIRKSRHLEAERQVLDEARVSTDGVAAVVEQDAIEFLRGLSDECAELLLTDPPYMTDVPDIQAFVKEWVPLALSKVKANGRIYICTGPYPQELQAYLTTLLGQDRFKLANILVWTYRNTLGPAPANDYKNNWQAIFYLYGLNAAPLNCPLMNEQFSVQDISAPDGRIGNRYHAWQKPDELAERIIRHSTERGATVIDPFAGTGTFVKIAGALGRYGLGAEHDPEALAICGQRGVVVSSARSGGDRP